MSRGLTAPSDAGTRASVAAVRAAVLGEGLEALGGALDEIALRPQRAVAK